MMIELALMASLYTDLNVVAENASNAMVAPMADVPTVVEAPDNAWGIRPVIRDAKSDFGLDIVYKRGSTCAEYPKRRCLEVHIEFLNDEPWLGYYMHSDDNHYDIYLNKARKAEWPDVKGMSVSGHEFGHFLGFSHHDDSGLMSVNDWWSYTYYSNAETTVLWDTYVY